MSRRPWQRCLGASVLALGVMAAGGCDDVDGDGTITVTIWNHDNAAYEKANQEAFAAYMAANPDVKIVSTPQPWHAYTTKLTTDLKTDQFTFDMVLMPPSVVCTYKDNLADVPEDVVSLGEAQNTFFGPPLEGATCGGKLKALPVEYNLEYGGVIVNMDLYQAKFPGRTPNWPDWASFIAEAAQLAERDAAGKPCLNGLDIDPDWPEPVRHIFLSQILQRGGKYWNAAGDRFTFDSPEARASFADMIKWVNMDKVMSLDLVPNINTMVTVRMAKGAQKSDGQGKYGCSDDVTKPLTVMGYAGTWALKDIKSTRAQLVPDNNTRYEFFVLPPMYGPEHRFVQNAGFALAVPKTSKNAKLAWDIIKSMALSPAAMKKWAATAGTLPALKENGRDAAVMDDPLLRKVAPLLGKGQWMGYIPAASHPGVLGAMVREFFLSVKGMKMPEDALRDMEKAANESIMTNQ